MSAKKKILMVIPNFGFGGAQRSFSNLSNRLSENHEVINVVFNLDHGVPYPINSTLIDLKIAGGGNIFNKVKNFLERVNAIKELKTPCSFDALEPI